jgi:hypothetical protein
VVGLNAQITLAQSSKGDDLLNRVWIWVLQLELVVVKNLADEFIHRHPKSMLVNRAKLTTYLGGQTSFRSSLGTIHSD